MVAESQELEDWIGSFCSSCEESSEEAREESREGSNSERRERKHKKEKKVKKLEGKALPQEYGYQNSYQVANRIIFYKDTHAVVTDTEYNILG